MTGSIAIPSPKSLSLNEREELGVDPVLESRTHPVWGTLVDDEFGVLDDFGGQQCGIGNGNDLVIIPVQNQCGHVDPFQILGQIRFRERLDAEIGRRQPRHHALQPE